MVVGEHTHIGAIVPTIPLYASLDTEPRFKQRTFAVNQPTRFEGVGQQLPGAGRVFSYAYPKKQEMFGLGLPMMPGYAAAPAATEDEEPFESEDSIF
jgi:hypothetical protein